MMAEKKKAKGWSLAEMQDTLVKDTEEKIEQGFKEIAAGQSGGVGENAQATAAVAPETAQRGQSLLQEPTQNINIPIPTSQHTRLKIISAQTRQTMKDMVVQAISLWLDVQEGKKSVKSPEL